MSGLGPLCPVDNRHGRLYPWSAGRYLCSHYAHGGNGRIFADEEATGGYDLKERDVQAIYETAAREVVSGQAKEDVVIRDIARQTKNSTAQVREKLHLMMAVVREQERQKEAKMADQAKAKAAKTAKAPKAPKAPSEPRQRLEHVEGERFAALRDKYGLTNKQVAQACGDAGMGASSTYVYIVTHKGSSIKLYERYEAALKAYVEAQEAATA